METAFAEYWEKCLADCQDKSPQLLLAFREIAWHAFSTAWTMGARAGFSEGYLTKK